MGDCALLELERLLDETSPRREPDGSCELAPSPYVPWWAQRQLHRPRTLELKDGSLVWSQYRFRVTVAARQTGKTEAGARELVSLMLAEPGSYSALLAPTYQIAQAAIDKVLAVLDGLGMRQEWTWREQKKRLTAPNGSVWAVFSADRKETVRGPTITGILWIDEGAFLAQAARDAAYGALTGNTTARVLITTTPKGLNWVHQEFTTEDPDTLKLRFRSVDSPYSDHDMIERMRQRLSAEMFAQEFEAEFVQSLLLPFPPDWRQGIWVDSFEARTGAQNFIGVDLDSGESGSGTKSTGDAKADAEAAALSKKDFTCLTLCNDLGEATPLDRWQGERWPETTQRVAAHAKAHNAIVVVEIGGPGGGAGKVLADYLERDFDVTVIRVNVGSRGTKGEMVEQLRADGQWQRFKLVKNEHFAQVDHELGIFQGRKRLYQGKEFQVYEGPQIPGEHDDWVISLCLANQGRYRAGPALPDPLAGDFAGFGSGNTAKRPAARSKHGRSLGGFGSAGVGGGGYY